MQRNLSAAFSQANARDTVFMTWIELVCTQNIAPATFNDESFTKHLHVKKKIGYEVLINIFMYLDIVVE